MDLGITQIQYDLILTYYIGNHQFCKQDYKLRFQLDVDFGEILLNLLQRVRGFENLMCTWWLQGIEWYFKIDYHLWLKWENWIESMFSYPKHKKIKKGTLEIIMIIYLVEWFLLEKVAQSQTKRDLVPNTAIFMRFWHSVGKSLDPQSLAWRRAKMKWRECNNQTYGSNVLILLRSDR